MVALDRPSLCIGRIGMARRIALMAAALTLLSGLAGCDKCGDWQQLRVPELPKSCADHGAR